jgi:Glycosyltransferase 61
LVSPRPFLARARRKLGGAPLFERASERIVLSPAITSDRPAAIQLPGEFDRALKFYDGREAERLRICGGPREEGATVAYVFDDALVAHGAVYKGLAGEFFRNDGPRHWFSGRVAQGGEALLAASQMSEVYFGDWLVESFSLGLLAEQRGVPAIGFARKPWLHEPGYRSLFGILTEPVAMARFKRLWIIDDRGMNTSRGERFRVLRQRLRANVAEHGEGPKRVFLTRGSLGQARSVVNADALEAFMSGRGYAIVHPEREQPASLARTLRDAEIVVTVEGSAQVHALLAMPDAATLTILQPPMRFTAPGKDMADLAGLRYAFMVGDPDGAGFSIDLVRLAHLLDRVEA